MNIFKKMRMIVVMIMLNSVLCVASDISVSAPLSRWGKVKNTLYDHRGKVITILALGAGTVLQYFKGLQNPDPLRFVVSFNDKYPKSEKAFIAMVAKGAFSLSLAQICLHDRLCVLGTEMTPYKLDRDSANHLVLRNLSYG